MDRLLQQALLQVMEPVFDPGFSKNSFGFRKGRGCHQAVRLAKQLIQDGNQWVVDIDLEKFFDRVNHDVLMDRVARKVEDKQALRLIRGFMQAGILEGGLISPSMEGTPQGGPLSPLLSNIMLDELDKELAKRGHRFCRYADDCNVYVKTRRAGERLMKSITKFLSKKLRLSVNAKKSAVDQPWNRQFLGFSFLQGARVRICVAPEREKRMKEKTKPILRMGRGCDVVETLKRLASKIRGWAGYFGLAEFDGAFKRFDVWLRRRIRAIYCRQWKRPSSRVKELQRLGIDRTNAEKSARNGRGPWFNAATRSMNWALTLQRLRQLGWISISEEVQRLRLSS